MTKHIYRKESLICYMEKDWAIEKDSPECVFASVFCNRMGIARVRKDKWHPTKVRLTIREAK